MSQFTCDDLLLTPSGLRFQGQVYPCTVGRTGVTATKREGDGATPAGTHQLIGMLFRPDRLARPTDWALPIRHGDLWSDDPAQADYNMMVRGPYAGSAETLRRADPLYDLIILTNWNWPYPVKGRGSAIFIHAWRAPGRPTEGCIGLRRDHLITLAPRLKVSTRLIVPRTLAR